MDLPQNRQQTIRGLTPGTRLGRYAVVRRIGSGGMAELYLARLDGPEGFVKPVALKLMHPHLSDDAHFARMFLKEARIAATLEHPSIVQVLDVGEFGGEYFMALEFVHGKDLRGILADQGGTPMPMGCALRVVMDVGRALHYAHRLRDPGGRSLGIVHRDVSPSNVLLSYQGVVKLADFGVAKMAERSTATASGLLKGKMGYMSPEQCLQENIDARSDVFSLGVVLYEVTTSRRAFWAEQPIAMMNKVIDGRWTPPEEFVPGFPAALHEIIAKALEVEVDRRYANAEELVEALERFALEAGVDARVEALASYLQLRYGEPDLPDLATPTLELPRLRMEPSPLRASAPAREGSSRRWLWGAAMVGVLGLGGVLGWQVGRSTEAEPERPPGPSTPRDAVMAAAPGEGAAAVVAAPAEAATVEAPAPPGATADPIEPEPEPDADAGAATTAASGGPEADGPVADAESSAVASPRAKRRRKRSKHPPDETERAREILFPSSSP